MKTLHSMRKSDPKKPAKPRDNFPLFPHARGKWAKKIRGKLYYFGRWDDPDAAEADYLAVKDDLEAGRAPGPRDPDAVTVRNAVNHFLTAKKQKMDAGELSWRSFNDYHQTAGRVVEHFGKNTAVLALTAVEFNGYRAKVALTRGPVARGNEVQRVRSIFKYCHDADLIDRPVRFGPDFRKPTKRVLRQHKQSKGKMLFTREQVLLLLDDLGLHMRAMVMLGINGGFGNTDCGHLPLNAVDLNTPWLDFPRHKTGVARRLPLWPETMAALSASFHRRPTPKVAEAGDLFFITVDGLSWSPDDSTTNPISKRTTAALQRLKIHEPGMSFYWLRHTFATIGAQTKDQVAVNAIMAHADDSMPANYRQEIDDGRLRHVTDHVRGWLFGPKAKRVATPTSRKKKKSSKKIKPK